MVLILPSQRFLGCFVLGVETVETSLLLYQYKGIGTLFWGESARRNVTPVPEGRGLGHGGGSFYIGDSVFVQTSFWRREGGSCTSNESLNDGSLQKIRLQSRSTYINHYYRDSVGPPDKKSAKKFNPVSFVKVTVGPTDPRQVRHWKEGPGQESLYLFRVKVNLLLFPCRG